MALNFAHRPVFPAHISEKNGEGYTRPWHSSRGEMEECDFNGGGNRVDSCSPDSTSKDIVDLLPSDPFGMDIKTTLTAITGWLEDLEVVNGGHARSNNFRASQEDYDLFARWNLIWNSALKLQPFPRNVQFSEELNIGIQSFPSNSHETPYVGSRSFPCSVQFDEKLNGASKVNQYGEERDMGGALAPYDFGFSQACNMGDIVGFSNGSASCSSKLQFGEKVEGAAKPDGVPHEALFFAISYLGVKDLLSVERVCRSLCSTVRSDPLLWISIHIDQPLNERITDDLLVQLACRAQGNLQFLSLVECPKVTDYGMKRILETNPRLTKLCVPGCTRLSIKGMLNNIKTFNSNKDVPGIKHLRIGGLYGVTHEHFEEFKLLLGADGHKRASHMPRFYHRGNFYLPYDDDRAIDIEMCPRCEKFRLVYDCPAEGCQVKDKAFQICRACTLCIARCAQCGRCVNDNEYEETFCLQLLCSDCSKQLLKY